MSQAATGFLSAVAVVIAVWLGAQAGASRICEQLDPKTQQALYDCKANFWRRP